MVRFALAVCLAFLFAAPALAQSHQRTGPHVVRVDSLTGQPVPIAPRQAGTAVIGAADTVAVIISHGSPSDVILLTYASAGIETAATIVPTWKVWGETALTIYGTAGRSVSYLIFR